MNKEATVVPKVLHLNRSIQEICFYCHRMWGNRTYIISDVCAKWVLHLLTGHQKEKRVDAAEKSKDYSNVVLGFQGGVMDRLPAL